MKAAIGFVIIFGILACLCIWIIKKSIRCGWISKRNINSFASIYRHCIFSKLHRCLFPVRSRAIEPSYDRNSEHQNGCSADNLNSWQLLPLAFRLTTPPITNSPEPPPYDLFVRPLVSSPPQYPYSTSSATCENDRVVFQASATYVSAPSSLLVDGLRFPSAPPYSIEATVAAKMSVDEGVLLPQ